MIHSRALAPAGEKLSDDTVRQTLTAGLAGRFRGARLLLLVPDHTRTLPLPLLFRLLAEVLADAARLDVLIALGTHPPLDDAAICRLFGISAGERAGKYGHIRLLNHAWEDPAALASLGTLEQDEIRALAGDSWHPSLPDRVEVQLNRLAVEADAVLILGPTFPHEVAGFSGGAKYLFPGISGAAMVHASHWLGALTGVVGTIGIADTPVRRMIHAAARRLPTPVTLAALTVDGEDLSGIWIGDLYGAWEAAAAASAERHIRWCEKPFRRVLSCAPPMYDELWTAAKAMYKLEPAVALGGEVVIFAPHLEKVSEVHGKYIYEAGYHTLAYFLAHWERYRHLPLGVLAHCTHLRGSGRMVDSVEMPNVHLVLSSRIPAEDCARLNLGYLDPAQVDPSAWQDRQDEGMLYVPRAGETLYRLRPA